MSAFTLFSYCIAIYPEPPGEPCTGQTSVHNDKTCYQHLQCFVPCCSKLGVLHKAVCCCTGASRAGVLQEPEAGQQETSV